VALSDLVSRDLAGLSSASTYCQRFQIFFGRRLACVMRRAEGDYRKKGVEGTLLT